MAYPNQQRNTQPQRRPNNNNQRGQYPVQQSLPEGYLVGGYFDTAEKTIKREYINKYARELANTLSSSRPELKKTQIRGFYDKVKYAWDALERDRSKLSQALVSITELAPLAHQSVTKQNAPKIFAEFIDKNVDIIDDYESIKAFEQHFRAIICYYPESRR